MTPLSIQSITFSNFKALVNTTLPLGRFTLIVGPNGSGKSTALQAIQFLREDRTNPHLFAKLLSVTLSGSPELKVVWGGGTSTGLRWHTSGFGSRSTTHADGAG